MAIYIVLQDNVFVQLICSIQYRVIKMNADDAFYELQNPEEQIQAYVFDGNVWSHFIGDGDEVYGDYLIHSSSFILLCIVVRALVPRMNLDELFEQKGEVARAVLEELEKVISYTGQSCSFPLPILDVIIDNLFLICPR